MNPDWRKIEFENRGLSIQSVCFLGEGWNSRVYLVNDELVFRFPKRTENWEELKREISFLAIAADNLPLAVPHYEGLFPDSLAAPYGYALYRYLRGRAMDLSALSDEDRKGAADRVAAFLRALHGLQPTPELASLLPREDERTNAKEYLVRAEREIVPKLQPWQATALRQSFDWYLETSGNFSFVPVVLHADLSVDHLLMADKAVVAVIDFGDINWGDPDYDLMYLFVDCGWTFVEQVAQRYGHSDLKALRSKLRHFSITDQLGTILDGPGRALEGQVDLAWNRLHQLLTGSESNPPGIGYSAATSGRPNESAKSQEVRDRAERLIRTWSLKVDRTAETKSSFLAFGERGNLSVVLKVFRNESDEWPSGRVLDAFDGHGMVRVYEQTDGAVLLERLNPGIALAEVTVNGRDEEATDILAGVIQRMSPRSAGSACPTVQHWERAFGRYTAANHDQIPNYLVEEASTKFANLRESQTHTRLLHGDLHHHNVLFDSKRGWTAIDPKGVVGELEYEIGAALRNPYKRPELFAIPLVIEKRISQFAAMLKIDVERTLAWTFAQAVLSAIWEIEDGFEVNRGSPALLLAEAIRPMLGRGSLGNRSTAS